MVYIINLLLKIYLEKIIINKHYIIGIISINLSKIIEFKLYISLLLYLL